MEAGSGGGYGGRGIQQPAEEEVSLQPEWRRRSGSGGGRGENLILQPEWRRPKPTGSPSNPVEAPRKEEEKEMLLQPEWKRSNPSPSPSPSVWEPEWRRSRSTTTAYPWNQNYGVRKPGGSSPSGGVERARDLNESWRTAPPAPGSTFNILYFSYLLSLLHN